MTAAQDTPSDPAAWALYTADGRLWDTVYTREQADAADNYAGATVVELYRRAPGAVAAAPTEGAPVPYAQHEREVLAEVGLRDQAEEWADRLTDALGALLGVEPGEHSSSNSPWQNVLDAAEQAGWTPAGPALSAGEDEAAVERAARALYDEDYGSGSYEAREGPGLHESHRIRARRLLAAARGPRTQDDEA